MIELNIRLHEVKLKIAEKERLQNLLNRLHSQQSDLETKKSELYQQLKKEELDVEKLDGISITHFLHALIGDSSERLQKEKQEAVSAKLKYDEACNELSNMSKEEDILKSKLSELGDLNSDYNKLIAEKEEYLKAHDPSAFRMLEKIMEEKANIIAQIKETTEALNAGYDLKNSLSSAEDSLHSAENWGIYDMLGGGMISTAIKHSKLDDAQSQIESVQSLLRRFHRELEDVNYSVNLNIDIDSFLSFADYFFDSFFVDWAVQSRIEDALEKMRNTSRMVEGIISKLNFNKEDLNIKLTEIEKRKLGLVENS